MDVSWVQPPRIFLLDLPFIGLEQPSLSPALGFLAMDKLRGNDEEKKTSQHLSRSKDEDEVEDGRHKV